MRFYEYQKALKLIEDIEKRNVCFLVGAGISTLPPCKLPSGSELKDLVITILFSREELEPYLQRLKKLSKYDDVVPEILFQRISESIKDKLFLFFNILKVANPNQAHEALAYLSDKNNIRILTTNFDTFIDDFLKNKERIIHLHGSLNNLSQIMIRINQVGCGIEASLGMSLMSLTNDNSLYVLGYSGNDKDIIDLINSCNFKKIIWFVRNTDNKRLLRNISQVDRIHSCYVVKADLKDLFNDLSSHFKIDCSEMRYSENIIDLEKIKSELLENWSQEISMPERFACLGKLFFELEEYDLAATVFIHAVHDNYVNGIHGKSWFYNEAANCMLTIGNFDKGFEYAKKAIEYQYLLPQLSVLAGSYNIIGLLFLEKEQPEPKEAIPNFKSAISTLEQFSTTPEANVWKEEINVFFGRIFNNLGLAYHTAGDFNLALEYYKKSLKYKKRAGDLIGIAHTSVNICKTQYRCRNYRRFYYWKNKSIDLIEKYQLDYQKAYLLREIGAISCEQGRVKSGLKMLRDALALYDNMENVVFDKKLTDDIIKQFSQDIALIG
ncbi:hypothetical protein ACSAZK_18025 [Methanosarcina sp. Mfa9]|uniref:hypothetical protein n=1 Tax=Methanosarcina sp. Mfa9 TaxID=3439063 RepID=UPI003F85E274